MYLDLLRFRVQILVGLEERLGIPFNDVVFPAKRQPFGGESGRFHESEERHGGAAVVGDIDGDLSCRVVISQDGQCCVDDVDWWLLVRIRSANEDIQRRKIRIVF